ncbi:apolipoprotein F [Carettochelys insculpta]|uniref:apolipoprotein F n=1 Tax=Carettochelys insculpta TaxID=44489 RepID=UPI003EC0E779
MGQALLCICLFLLSSRLHGHLLPPTALPGGAAGTLNPPGTEDAHLPSSLQAAARELLDSLPLHPPPPGLPPAGVSCLDLLPEALEGFSELPPLPHAIASAALALFLQGAGCPRQAEGLVLQLYGAVGVEETHGLLLGLAGLPEPPRQGQRARAALLFNVDQLAGVGPQRCSGLAQLHDSLLQGPATSTHSTFPAAALACHRLGAACAGVAATRPTTFAVIGRQDAYSLPGSGAPAWLHRCSWAGRSRRGLPETCSSQQEQKVHGVLELVPAVSTFYNLGSGLYYAFQNCTALARERAIEAAMDLGYDALLMLTGGVMHPVAVGVGVGLKPAVKVGVRSLISYFQQVPQSAPLPTSFSSPITASSFAM